MNTNYHNFRNSKGQFTPRLNIVAGRLYNFRGATVRALQKDTKAGARLISFHKTLFGFVKDSDLTLVNSRKVKNYLAAA